jgi:homoserine kinase type II
VIGNSLWVNQEIVTIVDFDFLAYHERIFDIAYALYWIFVRLEPEAAVQDWSWDRAIKVLGLYNAASGCPLSKQEYLALPLEMARVPLYWIAEAVYLEHPVDAVLNQANDLVNSEWLIDQFDDLMRE